MYFDCSNQDNPDYKYKTSELHTNKYTIISGAMSSICTAGLESTISSGSPNCYVLAMGVKNSANVIYFQSIIKQSSTALVLTAFFAWLRPSSGGAQVVVLGVVIYQMILVQNSIHMESISRRASSRWLPIRRDQAVPTPWQSRSVLLQLMKGSRTFSNSRQCTRHITMISFIASLTGACDDGLLHDTRLPQASAPDILFVCEGVDYLTPQFQTHSKYAK